jgi:hypothetical protein
MRRTSKMCQFGELSYDLRQEFGVRTGERRAALYGVQFDHPLFRLRLYLLSKTESAVDTSFAG